MKAGYVQKGQSNRKRGKAVIPPSTAKMEEVQKSDNEEGHTRKLYKKGKAKKPTYPGQEDIKVALEVAPMYPKTRQG